MSDGRYNTTRKSCPVCQRPVRATESTATIMDGLGLRHLTCVYDVSRDRVTSEAESKMRAEGASDAPGPSGHPETPRNGATAMPHDTAPPGGMRA